MCGYLKFHCLLLTVLSSVNFNLSVTLSPLCLHKHKEGKKKDLEKYKLTSVCGNISEQILLKDFQTHEKQFKFGNYKCEFSKGKLYLADLSIDKLPVWPSEGQQMFILALVKLLV